MLKKMKLTQYKGFRKFEISFGKGALLIGPNNAGKSTIINAVKICNSAAKYARRVRARDVYLDGDRHVTGWPLAVLPEAAFMTENVRHEFQEIESRIDLEYVTGAIIHMIWPVDDLPFFWISSATGSVTTAAKAKELLNSVGLVPTLTPIEADEKVLTREYLNKHTESKLSSRHFRNALSMHKDISSVDFDNLREFILQNTPEIHELFIDKAWRGEQKVDVYYQDADSQVRKEVYWAGDGMQIWLQILYHLWRTREFECVLLDEPDVFLHPDLQRRLVRVLEAGDRQVILSSHASEVASESSQANLTWVEKSLTRARRVSTDAQLADISGGLGSAFNLSIARALKAKVALFVEGQDVKVLRIIARRLGATNFAAERKLAVTPIGGYSHWPNVESFGWLKSQFLGADVHVALLLDRDYRSVGDAVALEGQMAASDVDAHVWRRKELESYLLIPSAIARVSGLPEDDISMFITDVVGDQKSYVQAQMTTVALSVRPSGSDIATVISDANQMFEDIWSTSMGPLSSVPAKKVLASVNERVVAAGGQTFSVRKLAEAIRASEHDAEMVSFIRGIEEALAG